MKIWIITRMPSEGYRENERFQILWAGKTKEEAIKAFFTIVNAHIINKELFEEDREAAFYRDFYRHIIFESCEYCRTFNSIWEDTCKFRITTMETISPK